MPADRRAALIIVILGALSTVSPFAIDMYLPAFPEIATALGTEPSRIALSISSYFVGLSLGQVFYGPLLDRYGRKGPLQVGLAIYVLSALAIVQVQTVESLVALRFVQALGGCAASVASMAMVRDFFPAQEGARVFSLLMLMVGLSPLLAPTVGGLVVHAFGWQAVFLVLAAIGVVILGVSRGLLPPGPPPDVAVTLSPGPILRTYVAILREPQFLTYALAGAFSFGGLFVYVAGSPTLFMEIFKVGPRAYGALFAALSVGFIGSSQLNLVLARRFSSEQLFAGALAMQAAVGIAFAATSAATGGIGLAAVVVFLFLSLSSLGIANPNSASLALAPFDRNVGSASALLGSLQIGVGALASMGVGLLDSRNVTWMIALMAASAAAGLAALGVGRSRIGAVVVKDGASVVMH